MRTSGRLAVVLQSIVVSTLSGCGGEAAGGQPAGMGGDAGGERGRWPRFGRKRRGWCVLDAGSYRVRPVLLLGGLVALGVGACGAASTATGDGGSGGLAVGGGSSAGATQGGNANAGAVGLSGSGGAFNQGTGGIYEVCLICAGSGFGAGTHVGSGGAGGGAGGAGGAGTPGGGAAGSGAVVCGDATCAANQYCRAACTGFGGAFGKPSCADLPAPCSGVPTCACICGGTSSFCTPGAPEVQCGCG